MYADENDFMFMETSAKTDMNIDYVFVALGIAISSAPVLAPSLLTLFSFILFLLKAKKLLKSGPGHEQPDDSQEPYVSGYRQSVSFVSTHVASSSSSS